MIYYFVKKSKLMPFFLHHVLVFSFPGRSCDCAASARALPGIQGLPGVQEVESGVLEEPDASAKAFPGTQGLSGASSQKLNMDSLPCFPFIKVRCSFSLAGSQSFKGCLCPPR